MSDRQKMSIVIVGHVDHGKSTIIGRLLADTSTLPEGKLDQIRNYCERNSKPFEYAFLIDALKDEQSQGITIDTARVFFKTAKRDYIINDAPGHIEFLKNMVTGASRADAALLVIDAHEGVRENSKRHGYILSMLGIRQIAVLVNKMDLAGYSEDVYREIQKEYNDFLANINVIPEYYIPVSGMQGDNITGTSNNMKWYNGYSVLDVLDSFTASADEKDRSFRMPVQDVYKFSKFGDERRIIAGTIETGSISEGEEIVFYPSGKKSRIKKIESFNSPVKTRAVSGYAVGFTLDEQVYVTRGELAAKANELKPEITSMIRVSLFWLSKKPMVKKKMYMLKLGSARVTVRLEEIERIIDASTLKNFDRKNRIDRYDVAECILKLSKEMAFDVLDANPRMSRFVIVDNYEISGGGIILKALEDKQSWIRNKVLIRNSKWEESSIPAEVRSERYSQKSCLILITGAKDVGKKPLARALEKKLFEEGKVVYFLGIANILYGVDADIKGRLNHKEEHIRRLAEVVHIMLDAGVILIVTAIELMQEELDLIKTTINQDKIETIWIGNNVTTNIEADIYIESVQNIDESVSMVKEELQNKGFIFKPW